MIRLTVLVLFGFLSSSCFARGVSGYYDIIGQAYDHHNQLLLNETISVTFGNEEFEVLTDDNGYYKISIFWMTPCRSPHLNKKSYSQINKEFNERWVVMEWNNKFTKIRNTWRKYYFKNILSLNRQLETKKKNIKFR